MQSVQKDKESRISTAIDPEKKLRPWQTNFWEALIGKCPGKIEDGAAKLTPEALWDLACLYFAGEAKDTMKTRDFIRSGDKAGMVVDIEVTRPFSWNSFELFCLYHGIRNSLADIRSNRDGRFPEFQEVVNRINSVIYEQKFDGAAIGGYNPQLIIRDLGLAEKQDVNLKQEQPLFVDTPQPPHEDDTAEPANPIDQDPDQNLM